MSSGSHHLNHGYPNYAHPHYYGQGGQAEQFSELKKMIQTIYMQLGEMEDRMDLLEQKVNQVKNIDFSSPIK
ncbi:hypothetical protein NDK47_02015 [Brevibacillus ruminantium]|uniref:Uncharacterized protein n=1 Tax=Brevibacillus ruminantium TaxID=2950604 RepID=A0ABY4WH46_9BACL|nr:hypothetical protein [Brevibacillus ruminantium]USG66136.1 hypothetical protein NDK47_02015 [Brevibacillus ruminantium]